MKRHTIRSGILLVALFFSTGLVAAEKGVPKTETDPDDRGIRAAIQNYLDGTTFNDTELIQSAFYDDARLFLSHPEREIWILPIGEYLGFFADGEKGKSNGRVGKILSIERSNDIATAKAEISSETNDARYIDLFLLKRIQGEWKIISKAATRTD
ncbi:MAG: nuclear transport factor 2 family protein [Thermoanaerobaculia bacterium]|nr:nuclear transport factor 2 family protein [Thermoanaerobaculia bacterium]